MSLELAIIAPYPELAEMAKQVCDELEIKAEIAVGDLDEGVKLAKKFIKGGTEIIISRGGTATAIMEKVGEPVIEIMVSPYDIIRAVASAKNIGNYIGIVGFKNVIYGSESLGEILDVKIKGLEINDESEVLDVIEKAKKDNIQVIVGDAVSVRYSKKQGLKSILVYSGKESVSMALREAKELASVRRKEKTRAEQLKAILDFTYEGIIASDSEGIVTVVNPAAEKILGKDKTSMIGQTADQVLPSIALGRIQEKGKPLLGEPHRVGNKMIVHNLIPLNINNEIAGTVITFQEASHVQAIETKVRRELYLKGHVAQYTFENILTDSLIMKKVIQQAKQFAKADTTAVITGETGTGKEMFAQSIHNNSNRRNGLFVAVNCASVPENLLESELFGYEEGAFTGARRGGKKGLFELAHEGTLFLDEIGELSIKLQARLLRVLQEKAIIRVGGDTVVPVDVRIIAATHRNLEESVSKGLFRQDLYYRLNVLRLSLPPLRERLDDIPLLIDELLKKICKRTCNPRPIFSNRILNKFGSYDWPGNVRELENILERLVALKDGTEVQLEDIDEIIKMEKQELLGKEVYKDKKVELKGTLEDMEREIISITLNLANQDKEMACNLLGISQTTLWRRLKKWNMSD